MKFAPMQPMQEPAPASHLCSKLCRKESCCQPSCTATHHQQRRMLCINTDTHHAWPVSERTGLHDCLFMTALHDTGSVQHRQCVTVCCTLPMLVLHICWFSSLFEVLIAWSCHRLAGCVSSCHHIYEATACCSLGNGLPTATAVSDCRLLMAAALRLVLRKLLLLLEFDSCLAAVLVSCCGLLLLPGLLGCALLLSPLCFSFTPFCMPARPSVC